MAEIIKLRAGQRFPRDEGHVLVELASSGLYVANGSVLRPSKGVAYYSPHPGKREEVLANALAWASQNGVRVVYVRSDIEEDTQFDLVPAAPTDLLIENVNAPTLGERAFELARSGQFPSFAHVRARLRVEGYSWGTEGKMLHTQLKVILRNGRRRVGKVPGGRFAN